MNEHCAFERRHCSTGGGIDLPAAQDRSDRSRSSMVAHGRVTAEDARTGPPFEALKVLFGSNAIENERRLGYEDANTLTIDERDEQPIIVMMSRVKSTTVQAWRSFVMPARPDGRTWRNMGRCTAGSR